MASLKGLTTAVLFALHFQNIPYCHKKKNTPDFKTVITK